MVGGLLTSVFVLGVCTQMVQSVFAAPAAAVKGGAKVSIANFAFTPGEITIAPGETVTWTNDDGAPHGLEYNDGAKGVDLCCREQALAVGSIGPAPTNTIARCIPI